MTSSEATEIGGWAGATVEERIAGRVSRETSPLLECLVVAPVPLGWTKRNEISSSISSMQMERFEREGSEGDGEDGHPLSSEGSDANWEVGSVVMVET